MAPEPPEDEPMRAVDWMWQTAIAEGPELVRHSAWRACAVVASVTRGEALGGWHDVLALVERHTRGEKLEADIVHAREGLIATERVAQIVRVAYDAWWFAKRLEEYRWWETCASCIEFSLNAVEAVGEHYGLDERELLHLCQTAFVPRPLTNAAVWIATRDRDQSIDAVLSPLDGWTPGAGIAPILERLGFDPARVASLHALDLAGWWSTTTVPAEQLAALGPFGVPPARRSQLLVGLVRPLLAILPSRHAAADAALSAATSGCDRSDAYALAVLVMNDTLEVCRAIERGHLELTPPIAPERRHLAAGAIWQILSACAACVLVGARLDVPQTLAEPLELASIGLDPEAPLEAPVNQHTLQRHRARIADSIRAALGFDELASGLRPTS